MNAKQVKICEKLGWTVDRYKQKGYDGKTVEYVELAQCSPAGEDFRFEVEGRNFAENVKEYYEDYDIDDHVELWIPCRGKGGCPSSIARLVEDAKAIESMLEDLAIALANA